MLSKYQTALISVLLLSACGESIKNEGRVITDNTAVCSTQQSQNEALWEYLQEDYLWNDQLDLTTDTTQFSSLNDLLVDVRDQVPLDRFSFAITEQEYQDNYINAVFYGYGLAVQLNEAQTGLKVKYVYDSSNAAAIGIKRGSFITSLGGKTIIEAVSDGTYQSSEIWGPQEEGNVINVTWADNDGNESSAEMSRASTQTNTVMATQVISTNIGKVGYLVFNSFIERSADDLNVAFDLFKQEEVTELVLDLRYNGGGYLSIANQLASQIGGANVLGKRMFSYIYNNNTPTNNLSFELGNGQEQLDLSRVVILTTEQTASASEVIINALAPYIDVKVVGSRTTGKPVGMDINKLCEHRIFALNFQMVNADGFGDYFDGLPVDCAAEDTITADWGHTRDPMLTEALYLLNNNSCSANGMNIPESRVKTLDSIKPNDKNRI